MHIFYLPAHSKKGCNNSHSQHQRLRKLGQIGWVKRQRLLVHLSSSEIKPPFTYFLMVCISSCEEKSSVGLLINFQIFVFWGKSSSACHIKYNIHLPLTYFRHGLQHFLPYRILHVVKLFIIQYGFSMELKKGLIYAKARQLFIQMFFSYFSSLVSSVHIFNQYEMHFH